ncbi:MAG: ribonuclease E/G, partial [Planctomycetota bacterium]|nr:ribonuclease E/G [Planctomycetota bacterium]
VNSGKSRESRDAETNAYQTNVEAVDEICRQLRLRDMGGIVINDLIDMRRIEHRKDIENRFKERMKRDRAKTTVLQISEFGILEMTRQRMRPSHESTHFTDCPTCRGRGLVQKPDSVAADALRDLAAVLDVQRVHKIELAVSARVAGDLLSHKRQFLGRMERHYGKHVDVRVSEALPVDRVSFYAYDDQGADIDLTNLPQPKKPKDLVEVVAPRAGGNDDDWAGDHDEERRKLLEADGVAEDDAVKEEVDVHPIEIDEGDIIDEDWPSMDGGSNKANRNDRGGQAKGKRGGRGGRGGRDGGGGGRDGRGGGQGGSQGGGRGDQPQQRRDDQPRQDGRSRQEPRADSRRAEAGQAPRAEGPRPEAPPRAPELGPDGQPLPQAEGEGGRRRRRRRRRGRGRGGEAGAPVNGGQPGADGFVNDDGSFEDGPAGEAPEGDAPAGDGVDAPAPMPRRAPVAGERGFVPLAAGGNWGDDEIDPAATPRDSGPGRNGGGAPASRPQIASGEGAEDGDVDADGPEGDGGDAGGEGGPVGEGGGGGEQGEGGRRRKRRRRRRGRGSRGGEGGEGGEGGGAPAEAGGAPVEQAASAPAPREQQVGHQPRHQPRTEGQNQGEARGESRGEQPRGDRRDGGEQPVDRQPERQPERQSDRQGGRRDGRNGRGGGRGGRGDSDRRDRGSRGDGGGGGGGGGGEVAAPAPQQPKAESGGSPPSQPAPAPKPRTLYGAIRRKLSASELNKRPKAE